MPETLPSECTRQYLTISAVLLRPAGFRPGRKGTDADSRGVEVGVGGKQDVIPPVKAVTKLLWIC